LTAFVSDLASFVHTWGGVVSYDVTARSDPEEVAAPSDPSWENAPRRRDLGAVADYTILMAYEQHWRYSEPGPVAAPAWVEEVLTWLLRYTDPHRVILGVPFYGRIWAPDHPVSRPVSIGLAALEGVAATGVPTPDPRWGIDRIDLADGAVLWREDAALIAARMRGIERWGLGGWAGWRLGLDSPSLWALVGD
jgi:spore germination protein YaaH